MLDYTGRKPLEPEVVAELECVSSWILLRKHVDERKKTSSSRLNQWAEEIPEHCLSIIILTACANNSFPVKWNPYMKDDVFFDQSACKSVCVAGMNGFSSFF